MRPQGGRKPVPALRARPMFPRLDTGGPRAGEEPHRCKGLTPARLKRGWKPEA